MPLANVKLEILRVEIDEGLATDVRFTSKVIVRIFLYKVSALNGSYYTLLFHSWLDAFVLFGHLLIVTKDFCMRKGSNLERSHRFSSYGSTLSRPS